MKPIFLCYPKCSTCQKAKRFLEDNNVDYELRDIVKENPKKEELLKWMELYGGEPRKFFNVSGMAYRELGLKDKVKTMTPVFFANTFLPANRFFFFFWPPSMGTRAFSTFGSSSLLFVN